jgi:hypothetical protein
MSFGVQDSVAAGGSSLTGLIVSKATQSRKDARKSDKKEKKKEKTKEENSNSKPSRGIGSKLLGSLPSLKNIFSFGSADTKKSTAKTPRSSGGTTGLAKILTNGFGSLTADTLGISSGLAAVTSLLNNSLKAQTFTATGVQTINSILSDQLENQSSILSTVKSLRTGGGGPSGAASGKSMFGSDKSSGVGGETLTEAGIKAAMDRGFGKFLQNSIGKLLDPIKNRFAGNAAPQAASKVAGEGAEAVARKKLAQEITERGLSSKGTFIGGKYVSMTASEAAQTLAPKAASGPLSKISGMLSGKLGGKLGGTTIARLIPGVQTALGVGFAAKELMEGDVTGAGLALGSAIPGYGYAFLAADIAREIAGPEGVDALVGEALGGTLGIGQEAYSNMSGTMSGVLQMGMPSPLGFNKGGVMIGEAGKEAVVDLNSNQGKNLVGNQSGDVGMKASGASTLAVVDQFIKGMGSLGAPVSQALGPDIQNLTRSFGMSQALPNLKIGGGTFKEDGNAKKNRDKFLEKLISGSLEALDAKKKDDKKDATPSNPIIPPSETPTGVTPPESNDPSPQISDGSGKPMDAKYNDPTSAAGAAVPNVSTAVGQQLATKKVNQHILPFRQDSKWRDTHQVLLNAGNGSFEVWEKPGIFNWVPKRIFLGKKDNMGEIQNSAIGKAAFNEVRSFMRVQMPETAKTTFKWISDTDIDNANKAKTIGNWQQGGTVKPVKSFDSGGGVQKPWWDFLGWATGAQEVKKGTTGIYSNSPMGKIGEAAAQRNKMMKELGYEKGGSMFGTEATMVKPIEKRVEALEEIIAATAIVASTAMQQLAATAMKSMTEQKPKAVPLKAAPSSVPVGATRQEGSGMSSAAIINVIGSSGTQSIPVSSEKTQSTSDYIMDPNPSGLAGVLCTSPWSVV